MIEKPVRPFWRLTVMVLVLILNLVAVVQIVAQDGSDADKPVVRFLLFYGETCPHCHEVMDNYLPEVYEKYGKVDAFVATAGTPTTVASMKLGLTYDTYDASKINGMELETEELDLYLDKLLSMPLKEREIAVGTGRSDLIVAGILIYKQLFNILEFDRCVIIDDGLREGVAIELCMDDAHKL